MKKLLSVLMCSVLILGAGGCSREPLTNEEVKKHFEENNFTFSCDTSESSDHCFFSDGFYMIGYSEEIEAFLYKRGGVIYDFVNETLYGSGDASDYEKNFNDIMKTVDVQQEEVLSVLKDELASYMEEKEEEEVADMTLGERNALKTALDYLYASPFSKKELIEQLEYEGFTTQEAETAIENCYVDWNKQAEFKAKSYMDSYSFSKQRLLEQLLYEGFTQEQAEYGVKAVGY